MQPETVLEAVRAYAAMHPRLVAQTHEYVDFVRTLLDDAGIDYLSVTGRAKSVASFAAKAARTSDGVLLFPEPLDDITDVLGVRVITYVSSDVAAVAEVLAHEVQIIDDRDLGLETASAGGFGYASRHLLAVADSSPDHPDLAGVRASIQLRTVLQHAWAEFEHDIRYKGTVPQEHVPDLDRRFTLAAGLLELADKEFSSIRERLQAAAGHSDRDVDAPGISGPALAAFLAGHYADAGWSHTDHYAWISDLLRDLGITSTDELTGLLSPVDADAIIAHMGYRHPTGAVRRLDDALLWIFGEQYVDLPGNSHRVDKLQQRLAKLTHGGD